MRISFASGAFKFKETLAEGLHVLNEVRVDICLKATDTVVVLHQTARQLALYAYGQEDGEPDVRLMRLTPVSAPFGIAAFRSSYVVNGCVMHKWIGYSGDGTGEDWERQEEELVYITKSGEAYHRERSCLYLNPSIRLAILEELPLCFR